MNVHKAAGLDPTAPTHPEQLLAALLAHYEKPGVSPPSARMRAVVLHEQHQAQRMQASGSLRCALKLSKLFVAKSAYCSLYYSRVRTRLPQPVCIP
jgi:hypothetical protein